MYFEELLTTLHELSPQLLCSGDPRAVISSVRLCEEGGELPPETLCVCSPTLPAQCRFPAGQVGSVLICGSAQEPNLPEESGGRLNAAWIAAVDARTVYDRVLPELLDEIHRRSVGARRLLDGFLQNRGLQHMVDAAYHVLRNPIFITDALNKYAAVAYDETTFPPDSPFARFLLKDVLYERIDEGGLAFIRSSGLDAVLAQTTEPVLLGNPKLQTQTLYCGLRNHNVMAGKVWMAAVEHPFTSLDRELFSLLARLVSQELERSPRSELKSTQYSSLMLADLLTCSHPDTDMLSRCRAAFHLGEGYELSAAVVAPRSDDMRAAPAAALHARFKQIFPTQPTTILEGNLVVLLCMQAGQTDGCLAMLRDFAVQNDLWIGMSNRFQSLELVQHEYRQALRTLTLSRNLRFQEHVIAFNDISVYELLHCYRSHGKVTALISPEIRRLRDYDLENGSDYLKTLEAYFAWQGKPQAICDALHIHKNTLLYRLRRLSTMFGIDLDCGEEVLKYQLSLAIIRYVRRINEYD